MAERPTDHLTVDFDNHHRSAANPTAKSNVDQPLAKHYREKHPQYTGPPKLKLKEEKSKKQDF